MKYTIEINGWNSLVVIATFDWDITAFKAAMSNIKSNPAHAFGFPFKTLKEYMTYKYELTSEQWDDFNETYKMLAN